MKKFLTVLLALSVVFTYTVGTAFAASGVTVNAKADKTYTLDEVKNAIDVEAQNRVDALKTVKANFLANYDLNKVTIDGITYSKAAVEKVIDKAIYDITTSIRAVAKAQKDDADAIAKSSSAPAYADAEVLTAEDFAAAAKNSNNGKLYTKSGTAYTVAGAFSADAIKTYYKCTKAYEAAVTIAYDEGAMYKDAQAFATAQSASKTGKLYTKDGTKYTEAAEWANGTTTYYKATVAPKDAVNATYVAVQVKNQAGFDAAKAESVGSKLYTTNTEANQENATEATYEAAYYVYKAFDGSFTQAKLDQYLDAVKTEYQKYDEAKELQAYIQANANKEVLLAEEFAAKAAKITALFDAVVLANYSAALPAKPDSTYKVSAADAKNYGLPGEGFYSYQDQVKGIIFEGKSKLSNIQNDATNYPTMQSKYDAVKDTDAFFKTYNDKIAKIPTLNDEKWNEKDLASAKSMITIAMKSYLAKVKNTEYTTLVTRIKELQKKGSLSAAEQKELADKLAAVDALDADYAALSQVYENQIKAYTLATIKTDKFFNAGVINDSVVEAKFPVTADDRTLAKDKLVKVEALKAEADTMIKMVGIDGAPVYDKAAVEDGLESAIEEAYSITITSTLKAAQDALAKIYVNVDASYNMVKAEMYKVINGTKTSTSIQIGNKFYNAISTWDKNLSAYEDSKAKEVKAIIEETKAAVRAATTVAAVDDAFLAGYAKYAAVPTTADRAKAQLEKAFADKINAYYTEIDLIVNAKEARYGAAKFATDYPVASTDLKAALKVELKKAYTVEELKTIYDKIAAAVENLKTRAERNTDATAINNAIVAIKTPAATDKASLLELKKKVEEFKDYSTLIGDTTNYALRDSLLNSHVAVIAGIDAKEITDAAAAIMKDNKIDLSEKEAVNALIALVDAYEDNYGADAVKSIKTGTVLTVYDHDFTKQEVKAVEDAIAVIDGNAKPLDVKAIEAARKAYDALGENDINKDMYAKLIALEKVAKEYTVSSVESLKIKASSRASKGKIVVKWTVKGDASVADGYQVFRSTKRNSGYGNYNKPYFTTKSKSYKNTKSLKKGKRYYYKVRAYKVVDGKKVYSDYSNKAYRTAK